MTRAAYFALYAVVLFAGYAGWLLFGSAGEWTNKVLINVVSVLVVAVAAVICGLAARSAQGRARTAWAVLGVGLIGATVGETLWAYDKLVLKHDVFPGPADAAYLMFPVGMCVALLLFPAARSRQWQGRLVLDGLVMAGSLLIVSWLTVMEPIYHAETGHGLKLYASLAYPVLNMMTLTVAAVVLARSAGGPRIVLGLLTLGLAAMTLAESAFAYISVDNAFSGRGHYLLDIFWTAGILLITVAAAKGSEVEFGEQSAAEQLPGWVSVWLPFAPLMLAGLALAAEQPALVRPGPVIPVGVALLIAVLLRQHFAVSEDRRLLSTVSALSLRDPLTGLANRVLFHDRLNHAMQLRARDGQTVSVLAIDLDDFKLVNDTMGHAAGDELLVVVADRLRAAVRAGDTVSRFGGDEFGVIIEGPTDAAESVAQRILTTFDAPLVIDGREILVRPSVGLATALAGGPSDEAVEDLLKRADMAMYVAKRSSAHGGQSRLSRSPENLPSDNGLLVELRDAVSLRELTLVYQPKFNLKTSELAGVEALVRWPRSNGELLGPDEFLPLVRRHGLIGPVTEFVLTRALDDAASWHAAGAEVPVAINLFPPSLAAPTLPEQISRELIERGLSPSVLTIEITEDMVLDNTARTRDVLSDLRRRGIRVAIDDFGSGYSALSYLRDLPVDQVKLDRSFIEPIAHDPRAAEVVRAVIEVARVLRLTTVAEGAENLETVDCLRNFGCDYVQGYYYGPPLTAQQVLELADSVRAESQ